MRLYHVPAWGRDVVGFGSGTLEIVAVIAHGLDCKGFNIIGGPSRFCVAKIERLVARSHVLSFHVERLCQAPAYKHDANKMTRSQKQRFERMTHSSAQVHGRADNHGGARTSQHGHHG